MHSIVFDRRLTSTAAQLLGAKRLRLYQDCVFLKSPGHAETNWHSDLRMAPLDTNSALTAWIPLRPMKVWMTACDKTIRLDCQLLSQAASRHTIIW